MRPYALRPFVRVFGSSRLFSGVFFVSSSYVTYVRYRRAGDVGLTVRIPMPLRPLDQLDLVTGLQRDDRLLPVPATALMTTHALELALEGRGADSRHLHVEHALHRAPDLHLVGVGADTEGHGVELFLLPHTLLRHDRPENDGAWITIHSTPPRGLGARRARTRPA